MILDFPPPPRPDVPPPPTEKAVVEVPGWRRTALKAADVAASIVLGAVVIWLGMLALELLVAFVNWDQPRAPSAKTFRVALVGSAALQAWRAIRKRNEA
jgi:uncharacterized membrane protein YqjE